MTESKAEYSGKFITGAFAVGLHPKFVPAHACPYRNLYSAPDNIVRRAESYVAWGRPHFTCITNDHGLMGTCSRKRMTVQASREMRSVAEARETKHPRDV